MSDPSIPLADAERTLTWLHLSDLHCCPLRTGWDADRVLHALRADLAALRGEHGLEPDLLLFTGDAAFGELSGSPIAEQFESARCFFAELRELCGLEPERVFLVPGNHDVHRGEITPFETAGLASMERESILEMLRGGGKTWRRVMERLDAYRTFLESAGYGHLLDDPERLVFGRRLTIRGIGVGIAGLDSAWSCHGDDKNRLWLGGESPTRSRAPRARAAAPRGARASGVPAALARRRRARRAGAGAHPRRADGVGAGGQSALSDAAGDAAVGGRGDSRAALGPLRLHLHASPRRQASQGEAADPAAAAGAPGVAAARRRDDRGRPRRRARRRARGEAVGPGPRRPSARSSG